MTKVCHAPQKRVAINETYFLKNGKFYAPLNV